MPGILQYPGDHGGRGGFAVGACDGNHVPTREHVFGQPLGAAGVRQSGVQNRFHEGELRASIGQLGATDHIADHKHIGLEGQLPGVKALNQFNPERTQLLAHGGIDARVTTRDGVARFPCQRRQAAHECSANTKNMNMHGWILGGRNRSNGSAKYRPMDTGKSEIAAVAARMVVEEGLEFGPAKRRAAKQLGLPGRAVLPGNDEIEDAVAAYIALFCADTQPNELLALRRLALVWMERMAEFWPHLSGAVWHGTATRLSDIYIQLFCDDSKSAEISLIDHQVNYIPRTVTGLHGETVEALSVHAFCAELNEEVGVHLLIYDRDKVRGALRPDAKKRTPRGDLEAVRRLLHDRNP